MLLVSFDQNSGMTPAGHPVGMLDRDQRTTKILLPVRDVHLLLLEESQNRKSRNQNSNVWHENVLSISSESKNEKSCKVNPNTRHTRHQHRYLHTIIQRVKQVLVVGTYLLSIVNLPSSLSAPIMAKYTDAHGDWNSQPKWVNPLNYTGSAASAGSASPAGVSQQILDQTKLAFNSANSFVEGYVRERFGQSVEDLNSLLYPTYEWLPSFSDIPKKHRMTIASELLENLTMEELIVNVYEQLQKVAVGLEQVVWNLSESGTDFTTLKKFKNMERELQMVLIELQSAMIGLRLEQRPDVVRHAMPESVRDLDQTGRVQRDWVILRDYLNTLEYAIQALTEIRKRH